VSKGGNHKKTDRIVEKKDPEAKLENIGAFNIIKLYLIKGSVSKLEEHRKYVNEVFGGDVIISEGYSVELISNSISRSESEEYQFNCPRTSKDITARIGYRQ
jgi:hypothetical protein